MPIAGLIHAILFAIEDVLVWIGGKMGISFWIVIGLSLLVFYIFYRQIFAFVRFVLKKIGIGG